MSGGLALSEESKGKIKVPVDRMWEAQGLTKDQIKALRKKYAKSLRRAESTLRQIEINGTPNSYVSEKMGRIYGCPCDFFLRPKEMSWVYDLAIERGWFPVKDTDADR